MEPCRKPSGHERPGIGLGPARGHKGVDIGGCDRGIRQGARAHRKRGRAAQLCHQSVAGGVRGYRRPETSRHAVARLGGKQPAVRPAVVVVAHSDVGESFRVARTTCDPVQGGIGETHCSGRAARAVPVRQGKEGRPQRRGRARATDAAPGTLVVKDIAGVGVGIGRDVGHFPAVAARRRRARSPARVGVNDVERGWRTTLVGGHRPHLRDAAACGTTSARLVVPDLLDQRRTERGDARATDAGHERL